MQIIDGITDTTNCFDEYFVRTSSLTASCKQSGDTDNTGFASGGLTCKLGASNEL